MEIRGLVTLYSESTQQIPTAMTNASSSNMSSSSGPSRYYSTPTPILIAPVYSVEEDVDAESSGSETTTSSDAIVNTPPCVLPNPHPNAPRKILPLAQDYGVNETSIAIIN